MTRFAVIYLLVVAAVAALSPNDFYLSFATRLAYYGIYAMSLNILVGEAGLMSLGHSAFFGVAAYCVGWLTTNGVPGWTAVAAALALGTSLGLATGAVAVRVAGTSFMMITLAFAQVAWGLAYRWVDVTGGDNGIIGIVRPKLFGLDLETQSNYFLVCAVALLGSVLAIDRLRASALGASIRAARDQPKRMSALGYDVWAIRLTAFTVASTFASLAGALDCFQQKFVSPNTMSLLDAAMVLLMVVVGGTSSRFGPLVGAFIVLTFTEFAGRLVSHPRAALGALLLVVVVFAPAGLAPWLGSLVKRARRALWRVRTDAGAAL